MSLSCCFPSCTTLQSSGNSSSSSLMPSRYSRPNNRTKVERERCDGCGPVGRIKLLKHFWPALLLSYGPIYCKRLTKLYQSREIAKVLDCFSASISTIVFNNNSLGLLKDNSIFIKLIMFKSSLCLYKDVVIYPKGHIYKGNGSGAFELSVPICLGQDGC